MDNTWKEMIMPQIESYVAGIDFNHPDFKIEDMKKYLKNNFGITAAIDLKWSKETKVNELMRDSGRPEDEYKQVIEKCNSVTIAFVEPCSDPLKPKTLSNTWII